jgi:hypothetical protein
LDTSEGEWFTYDVALSKYGDSFTFEIIEFVVIEQRENGFGSRWEKVDNSTL